MTGHAADAHAHRRDHIGTAELAFVLCPAYHGATMLSLLLNNHTDIAALGDTNPARSYHQLCTCGAPLSDCEFWQGVRARTRSDRFANLTYLLPLLPWPLQQHIVEGNGIVRRGPRGYLSARVLPVIADRLLPLIWRGTPGAVADYIQTWEAYYDAVRKHHGTRLVVDGNKLARKVRLFADAAGSAPRPKVIHLVRDPRGFVLSARGRAIRGDAQALGRLWSDQHRRFGALSSMVDLLRIRYEDLATSPETELRRVISFLGREWETMIGPPRFAHKHHLIGNDMRFLFDGVIALDERWRSELPRSDARAVLAGAGRLAHDFGYGCPRRTWS